ncbi:hypothetical protein M1271_01970 [Patescibacteria group bacterium]|nr:hypothetical protein [Patescibacteria group bacterium]
MANNELSAEQLKVLETFIHLKRKDQVQDISQLTESEQIAHLISDLALNNEFKVDLTSSQEIIRDRAIYVIASRVLSARKDGSLAKQVATITMSQDHNVILDDIQDTAIHFVDQTPNSRDAATTRSMERMVKRKDLFPSLIGAQRSMDLIVKQLAMTPPQSIPTTPGKIS